MPEKRRKSRFFRIRKEEPGEEEAEKKVEEEAPEEEEAEELVKEVLEEEEAKVPEAKEKPEAAERLGPPRPPRKPDVFRHVEEDIYRLKGALKTLEGKLDRKEISPEEYEEKSKKLNLMLANLYEKKLKRELGI